MYKDRQRKTVLYVLALVLLLAAVLLVGAGLFGRSGRDISEEGAAAIKDVIVRAARQCYVVEGVYPPDLEYLQDNYGLHINTNDYYVTYDAFSSNLPPDVIVSIKEN